MNDLQIRPFSGAPSLLLGAFDLLTVGYEAAEYYVEGRASSYSPVGRLGPDGHWSVQPAETSSYATRIVVVRPTDEIRFNGTVIVEWVNVTSGFDIPIDWLIAHREIAREGYAYVAVSAQRVGVEGGQSRGSDASLKTIDPVRYASLNHPGDAFSFDIFNQIGRLIRTRATEILGNAMAKYVIAVGESQSAWYLTTYVNAIDPIAKVYDGFLIHSRFAPAAPIDSTSIFGDSPSSMPLAPRIRTDVRVPVLTLITETDLIGGVRPGFHAARQPDTSRFRLWEIAGAAHGDQYLLNVSAIDSGLTGISEIASAYTPTKQLFGKELKQFINFAPQHHYVFQAALAGLHRWIRAGTAPPMAPRLALHFAKQPTLVLDAHGIAQGGIRTPWVDVPVARTSGAGDPNDPIASMFGTGEYFGSAKLSDLYPCGKADYLSQFEMALDRSITAGFLLAADRTEILLLASACYP